MKQLSLHLLSGLMGGIIAIVVTGFRQEAPLANAQSPAVQPAAAETAPATSHLVEKPPLETAPALEATAEPSVQLAQLPPGLAPPPAAPRRNDMLGPDGLSESERIAVNVYEQVNRGVVNINTKSSRRDMFFLIDIPSEGAGSGSVIDRQGHILTNYHVIEGTTEVAVTLFNGKTYDASFVGADPINDTAVIKIDAPAAELFPVKFGDSNRMRVGMQVFAIGNPFGLERTLTTGVVSSLNRSLRVHNNRTIKSIIQIDAAINPGSSGGPLLDNRGHLIAMNTAIASRTGQSAGVGFAIPSAILTRIVGELIQNGRVARASIGIRHVYPTSKGLLIASLTPGGPAEEAGLHGPVVVRRRRGAFTYESIDRSAADLIVALDGEAVTSVDDFLSHIERKKPGDVVTVTVVRNGQSLKVPITLGSDDE